MKKLLFTLALSVQVVMAMATEKTKVVAQARQENVKMYQQAGTSSKLLRELATTDRLEVVRRLNNLWTIVLIDGEAGYVLHSELTKPAKFQDLAVAKAKK